MKFQIVICICIFTAMAASAHEGVQNPQVMARMSLMTDIANEMKALGAIAKGETEFETDVIDEKSVSLAAHARGMLTLFEMEADDPKSEAREEIWTDWDGFTAATEEMEQAALALGTTKNISEFQSAFTALGKSCSACHKDYRLQKN